MVLEGTIVDVFGPDAVVNVGVERPGTMEKSAMGGRIVRRGDRVRVEVISVELERNRFGLRLMEVIR
jgi:transcriptional accessory protein Tex/SPT6